MVLISTWLATACNVPLWQEVAQLPGQGSLRGWGFALAFALIVAAGNAALLSLLAWRWTLKPAVLVLVLMAAFGAYFMLAYGIAIDASMLINVMQTDVKEAGDLFNLRLLGTVRDNLRAGRHARYAAYGVAAWMAYIASPAARTGAPLPIDDPLAGRLASAARGVTDPAAVVDALLRQREIFGDDLPQVEWFRQELVSDVAELLVP